MFYFFTVIGFYGKIIESHPFQVPQALRVLGVQTLTELLGEKYRGSFPNTWQWMQLDWPNTSIRLRLESLLSWLVRTIFPVVMENGDQEEMSFSFTRRKRVVLEHSALMKILCLQPERLFETRKQEHKNAASGLFLVVRVRFLVQLPFLAENSPYMSVKLPPNFSG